MTWWTERVLSPIGFYRTHPHLFTDEVRIGTKMRQTGSKKDMSVVLIQKLEFPKAKANFEKELAVGMCYPNLSYEIDS
jgi:hypothetical protein